MGELRIIAAGYGDKKIQWNPQNEDEVEVAEMTFDKLVGEKGFKAFRVKKDGSKGTLIKKFSASIGMIIMVPQVAGG